MSIVFLLFRNFVLTKIYKILKYFHNVLAKCTENESIMSKAAVQGKLQIFRSVKQIVDFTGKYRVESFIKHFRLAVKIVHHHVEQLF